MILESDARQQKADAGPGLPFSGTLVGTINF